jgi:DNA polymerase-3 subunit delta'
VWKTIGQKRTIELLQAGLKRSAPVHAYLFVGPAHVGKMTLARDLACALNCNSDHRPCGECPSCLKILAGKHADVREIGLGKSPGDGKARTEISIEDVRDLQHSANLPPYEGKCKVFIIDGAEWLSIEAANCLLKTLEEPLPGVVFILLSTNEQLLLSTVVSRCQRIEVVPLPAGEIEPTLIEKHGVSPEKARLLARLSHGCLGWAVEATDSGILERHSDFIDGLVETIDGDNEVRFAYAAQLATEFGQNRESVQEKLELWLDWWRDLMLVKTGLGDMVTNIDRMEILTGMSRDLDLAGIRSVIECIREANQQLKLNANARLALEVMMLGLPESRRKSEKVKLN